MLLDEIKLPVQKRSQQRLEKVVEMAITILEKQGLENCTIPEVSFQSDVPKAHIYQYFPTINHLYILLIKRYLDVPLVFSKPEEMLYLIEIVFALMKHSFYKYQYITSDIQRESIDLCHIYLRSKGHLID